MFGRISEKPGAYEDFALWMCFFRDKISVSALVAKKTAKTIFIIDKSNSLL
jgi:hypothetical protein